MKKRHIGYSMQSPESSNLWVCGWICLKNVINQYWINCHQDGEWNNPTPFLKKVPAESRLLGEEPHTWYNTTQEQHERLKFNFNELAEMLERASLPHVRKSKRN
jgi:hypothetical protein